MSAPPNPFVRAALRFLSHPAAYPLKQGLRRLLGRYLRGRLRSRQQPWPGRPAGAATLVVAPHPDDEAFGCGGLIAGRTAAGEAVHVAFLTDGAASHPGHPSLAPAELAAARQAEARTAAAILGVPAANLHFFNAPDGRLSELAPESRAELVRRVRALAETVQPAEIFVTAAGDGSTEHTAANRILRDALHPSPAPAPRILEYPVWALWSPLLLGPILRAAPRLYCQPLAPDALRRKQEAIRAHATQVAPCPPWIRPVLPAGFTGCFEQPEEFFFEP